MAHLGFMAALRPRLLTPVGARQFRCGARHPGPHEKVNKTLNLKPYLDPPM